MGIERRLRALDDAVLGDRLRTPLRPGWRRRMVRIQLLVLLVWCAVLGLFGGGIPYDVVWPWLLIVLMADTQERRSRAAASERPRV